ncbi:MAG TPA: TetR family transcriptional regulator, partial [Candidatus Dormibacteraeota bacterium]
MTEALSRDRVVHAALESLQEYGLDGLSMRGLAERLDVKAASLYWHVRDRGELIGMLAGAVLAEPRLPRATDDWAADVLAVCQAVGRSVGAR